MGLKTGEAISAESLTVRKTGKDLVVFEGKCGERFCIRVKDWPALRDMLDWAMASVRKEGEWRDEAS